MCVIRDAYSTNFVYLGTLFQITHEHRQIKKRFFSDDEDSSSFIILADAVEARQCTGE